MTQYQPKSKELNAFLTEQFPQLPEIISPGILPRGHVLFLYGDEGTWKSWLVIELGFSIIRARAWLLWQTSRGRVLVINPEILEPQYQLRLRDYTNKRGFINGNKPPDGMFLWTDLDLRLDQPYGLYALEQEISHTQCDIIIVDGLYKVVSTDVTSGGDARRLIDGMDRLRQKYGFSLVIVHHTRQGLYDSMEGRTVELGTAEMYGSSLYRDWADTILRIRKEGWRDDLITVSPQKVRHAKYPPEAGTFFVDRERLKFWLT
jgi:RecA-family ATPase